MAVIAISLALGLSAAVVQREYLTEVVRPPVETTGTPSEIFARGQACISQQLSSGRQAGELIISSDEASGVVVANNVFEYSHNLVTWQTRSRLTFEARDGRFRVSQNNLERFNEFGRPSWVPIGKWRGSGWERAQKAFDDVAATVEQCVSSSSSRVDW